MLKRYFVVVTVLLLGLLYYNSIASAQDHFRVLTYNIWDPGDVPFWQKHAGGYPVDKVVDYITQDNADVLLFQEVTLESNIKEQAFCLIRKKLLDKGYYYTAFYKPDGSRGEGRVGYIPGSTNSGYPLAVFSKFPIEETYATQSGNGKTMSKGVLGIKIRIAKSPVFIFTTHLGIGSPHTDDEISKVALPFVNSIAGNNMVIFGGDLNSPPASDFPNSSKKIGNYVYSSQTTQPLLDSNFKDVWYILKDKIGEAEFATCPGQDDYIKRVDQLYFRGAKLSVNGAFVKKNLWEYIHLKDHNAVVVDFQIGK